MHSENILQCSLVAVIVLNVDQLIALRRVTICINVAFVHITCISCFIAELRDVCTDFIVTSVSFYSKYLIEGNVLLLFASKFELVVIFINHFR